MVGIVCPRVRDIVEDVLAIHPVALGDRKEAFRPESTLGVDEQAFTLTALHVAWELRDHTNQSVDA